MELTEIIQKMKDAGLDPAQIPAATEIVADLVASGLDPQAVAEAYQAAIAPPPAPEIPEPKDSAPIFAYLLTPDGDNPEAPMLAVLAGIDVPLETVSDSICKNIKDYLDPLVGGQEGKGWNYGQAPTAAEISKRVFALSGVAAIQSMSINFIPTLQLNVLATLGLDTELENFSNGYTQSTFQGLPQLRTLDVTVYKDVA